MELNGGASFGAGCLTPPGWDTSSPRRTAYMYLVDPDKAFSLATLVAENGLGCVTGSEAYARMHVLGTVLCAGHA